MSLLIQISQTRQGAERLLECRVLTVLSQCDYLDARPEADQTFIGEWNSYFPRCTVEILILSYRSNESSSVRHPAVSSAVHASAATYQWCFDDVG